MVLDLHHPRHSGQEETTHTTGERTDSNQKLNTESLQASDSSISALLPPRGQFVARGNGKDLNGFSYTKG